MKRVLDMMIKKGKITSMKIDMNWLIDQQDIHEWLDLEAMRFKERYLAKIYKWGGKDANI